MPASASPPPSVPFPVHNSPHANGPMAYQQPANVLMRPQHRHGHSADYADPNVAQKPSRSHHAHARLSEQMLSKPLPTKPEQDRDIYSRQLDKTPAQRYKEQSLQKLGEKETRSRTSADLPPGQLPSGSVGRRATVDGRAPQGSSGSRGARRKPVREPSPAEFFDWAPGDDPQVLTTPITAEMPTGSHKSRNRHMGVYRDPPADAKDTWSKGTAPRPLERNGLSASVGHQPTSQPTHYVISSSSLGRHHSASASVPNAVLPGSARSTLQAVFPTTPTPGNPNPNQKIPLSSTSSTPTPKAQTFSNISAAKVYKQTSASNQDISAEERRRKLSHHRTASASTQAASPSSCSTTGSSHCDTWHSTSQNSHRQRARGNSDAPAPQTHYIGMAMGRSDGSVGRVSGEEERGRAREKDTSFMGRIRTRSNSLTKSLSKAITYPIYLLKDKDKDEKKKAEKEAKRQSKQQKPPEPQSLGQGGSAILTTASDAGHSLNYSYTSSSTATTTSTANSPVSNRSQSVQPRPKKLLSNREQRMRNDYRASPMTKAKNEELEKWQDVDLDPRMSGVAFPQVQVTETRFIPMIIPYNNEAPKPRRRLQA